MSAFEDVLNKLKTNEISEITPFIFDEMLKPSDALQLAEAIRTNTSCSQIDLGVQIYVGEDCGAMLALAKAIHASPTPKTLLFYDMLGEPCTYATPRIKIDAGGASAQAAVTSGRVR